MKSNDGVCILSGAKVPFILRPRNKAYKFMVECYAHGIMHGEICSSGIELKSFKIER
jgi:hypothetical protein